jgi:hypothetical protein
MNSLPRILAGETFRGVVKALEVARVRRKPITWGTEAISRQLSAISPPADGFAES